MIKDTKHICQSCAMPIEQTDSLGTNKDRSKNFEYCKFCFHEGQFANENISVEEKIQKNISIAKQMGMKEEARQLTENVLPKLKRWQKNQNSYEVEF